MPTINNYYFWTAPSSKHHLNGQISPIPGLFFLEGFRPRLQVSGSALFILQVRYLSHSFPIVGFMFLSPISFFEPFFPKRRIINNYQKNQLSPRGLSGMSASGDTDTFIWSPLFPECWRSGSAPDSKSDGRGFESSTLLITFSPFPHCPCCSVMVARWTVVSTILVRFQAVGCLFSMQK